MMMLEGPSWEAVWLFHNVPKISQMRATAQELSTQPSAALTVTIFFFLMSPWDRLDRREH